MFEKPMTYRGGWFRRSRFLQGGAEQIRNAVRTAGMTAQEGAHFRPAEEDRLEHDLTRGASVAVNGLQVGPATEIGNGLRKLAKINGTKQGNAQQAGFRAEAHHEATFNADAARKGLRVRIRTSRPGAAADLQVMDGQSVVAEVQVKNCRSVARTTKAISDGKYDGMQKVVPADQVDGVRDLAGKRGVDGLGERNYADTSVKASGTVEHGGAASQPLTYEDAQSRHLGRRLVAGEVGTAARSGAQSGAVIGGAMSAVGNVVAVVNGEKTVAQAAGAVARDATLAAAGGAVSAAATSAVTAGCTRVGMQALSKSGAPGAIAATGIEVAKDLVALRRGELTGRQVAGRSLEHAGGAGGAWAGAAAGAAIGSVVPVVGTAAGAIIGGMIGNTGARKAMCGLKGLFA